MNRLKELRRKKGLYQKDLAKILNISQGALSGYETERYQPDPQMLKKLANYFEVTIDYLLGRCDDVAMNFSKTKELTKIIAEDEYTIHGRVIPFQERQRLIKIIEAVYWQPKCEYKN
ncbi:helix-turn-helix domain-containing protein [Pectinatus sottacetonis]|uniref:helix-turn-helix domain-containing protein n=1 Tax=Pectinatus sottacetonis TaxID=1002795 RepID=UPI0018C7D457|nr:helix-turn-helix transcriptional regulator [Pectinatus sottacetonis]